MINQHLFNDNRLGEAKVRSRSTDDLYIVSSTCILYRERCADSELEAGLLHMPPTEKHKSSNFTSKHRKLKELPSERTAYKRQELPIDVRTESVCIRANLLIITLYNSHQKNVADRTHEQSAITRICTQRRCTVHYQKNVLPGRCS